MEQRLTSDQLTKLVGEVERLAQRRQDEVGRGEVEAILRELNLPLDLVDDALVQLQRREALAVQQQRNRQRAIALIAGLLAISAGGIFWWQQNQQVYARVTAQQDRLALAQDDGGNLATVSRPAEVVYHVTLKDAPVGKKLDLSCNWTTLGDQLLGQNRYQTKEITTPVWNTQCKHTLATTAPTGTWQVKMFLGDRPLSEASFEVK